MKRIFITGSADGLGRLAAKALVSEGHKVVLHARHSERASEALTRVPGAETVLTGDLSRIEEVKELGEQANDSGPFDAVIHNAGVYQGSSKTIFAVNTLAPYVLTCVMRKPKRLIYLTSGMHLQGRPNFEGFNRETVSTKYSDSKLHVLMLALTVARKWPGVCSNAVDPGWVPTKMGGRGAPDDLQKGYETQVWLAVSNDNTARVTGHYFHHQKQRPPNPAAGNLRLQETFLDLCAQITDIPFPT